MAKSSAQSTDALVQFRVPLEMAERIRQRAAETGAPLTQWIRDLIAREIEQPELLAWFADEGDRNDNARMRTFEHGNMNPHLLLSVLSWGGDHLGVHARGGPAQGRPPTALLSLPNLRAVFGHDILTSWLYVRGSGLWRIAHAFDVKDRPAHLSLKFERRPASVDGGR